MGVYNYRGGQMLRYNSVTNRLTLPVYLFMRINVIVCIDLNVIVYSKNRC